MASRVCVHLFHGTPSKLIEELWKEGYAPEKITAYREAFNLSFLYSTYYENCDFIDGAES